MLSFLLGFCHSFLSFSQFYISYFGLLFDSFWSYKNSLDGVRNQRRGLNKNSIKLRHTQNLTQTEIYIKRRMGLENLKLKRQIECKRDMERQLPTYLTSLCEWIAIRETGGLVKGKMLLKNKINEEVWTLMSWTYMARRRSYSLLSASQWPL